MRREVGQVRDDDVDEARDGLEEVAFAYENAIGHARTCCIACRGETVAPTATTIKPALRSSHG